MPLLFDKVKYRNTNLYKIKLDKLKAIYLFIDKFLSKRIPKAIALRKQKAKFKLSEEHFQFALEASSIGVWDWDIRTNTVFYSSQSMKILDLKLTDTFDNSQRWDKIVHPDDLEKYYATIQKHFDKKIPFYENYHRIITSDGEYKWILDKGKVIERDINGRPLRVIGTHIDISSQKEKELELKNKIELYRKQKHRLLNFSYIVSHNLNTHISNIKLLLDINELKGNKNDIETLMNLRTVSNDLNETLTDLSQIVNIQNNLNIVVKPLDINFYFMKVLSLINGYNHKNKVAIENNIPVGTVVNFNPAYLESVLLNFFTNAIRYAHPNRFPIIKLNFFIENEKKTLTIADNGLGIDLDKYGDLLFGMYKTFHRHKDGQGLGLYIAKNQIEAMKGQVSVSSKVGEGATFKIVFND
ncbi:PAS domain-containing sensor histidine kinase [Flavobacterium sp. KMS]|uniref:sensor histidine kinase n=1 Tax=Flavobacterium sp. KMS TaxID=1566023 RepID=UPI00068D9AD1|nr:PAS domain-containing sensor histidine kinase [Flavobacterium sp. KMS]